MAVALTLLGWALLIKGLIRFCAPKQGLRMMARVSAERSWEFQLAGALLVVLAGLLGYGVYAGSITPDLSFREVYRDAVELGTKCRRTTSSRGSCAVRRSSQC